MISLAKQDLVFKFDLSSLNHIFCAAAPLGKETMDTCATRFPNVKLQQVSHSFHLFRIQYSFLIIPLFTNKSAFLYVTLCNVGLNLCARILGICIDGIDMCWHHKPTWWYGWYGGTFWLRRYPAAGHGGYGDWPGYEEAHAPYQARGALDSGTILHHERWSFTVTTLYCKFAAESALW